MSKFFGNKAFYRTVLAVTIPIAVQNAISNFISLLDNVMVGQVGTEQMSGVTIARGSSPRSFTARGITKESGKPSAINCTAR